MRSMGAYTVVKSGDFIEYFKLLDVFSKNVSLYPRQARKGTTLDKSKAYRTMRSMVKEGLLERRELARKKAGDPCTIYTITGKGRLELQHLKDVLADMLGIQGETKPPPGKERRKVAKEGNELGFELTQEIGLVLQDYIEDDGTMKRAVEEVVKVVLSTF